MTIGEILRKKQPDVWIKLLIEFDLVDEFIPQAKQNEIIELIKPGTYSGRVERKHGAITQPHRLVFK